MPLKVVIVGFGTVGQGVAKALDAYQAGAHGRSSKFRVVGVLDSTSAAVDGRGLDLARLIRRKKETGRVGGYNLTPREVLEKAESDVVVEVTPGTLDGEPALSHMRAAIGSSNHVVTANKMPLALRYKGLLQEAKRKGVKILYGACVGGGLPVLNLGEECARAEPVDKIEGVLNATTNFVLSGMEKGEAYETALGRAQQLGYAEPDPSFDVDGLDAACKIVILANHVMGTAFRLDDVKPLRGIRGVTSARVALARKKGLSIRLVARAGKSASVSPVEVEEDSPLAARGRSHAVVFHCRYSGTRTIMGGGAGSVTTSLGVMRDLISLMRGRLWDVIHCVLDEFGEPHCRDKSDCDVPVTVC